MRILFFARLREQLGQSSLVLNHCPASTVAELRKHLIQQGGESWAEVLEDDNIIVAVNQEVAGDKTPVADGDEVAFFPPVTGG